MSKYLESWESFSKHIQFEYNGVMIPLDENTRFSLLRHGFEYYYTGQGKNPKSVKMQPFYIDGDKKHPVELVHVEGGGEGGAADCQSVFKIKGKFYSVCYNYASHYGFSAEYADVHLVEPVERMVTFYE